MAEDEATEDGGLLQDRASRRARKEEPKLSDVRVWPPCSLAGSLIWGEVVVIINSFFFSPRQSESPTNASIPELERQIDKLTKVKPGRERNTVPSQ